MILFPVPREGYLPFLICSLAAGVLLGAFNELFRVRRRLFDRGGVLSAFFIAIEDVIFFTVTAVVMILVSYKLNYGVPRWYSYGAAALGFIFWQRTAGALVLRLADALKKAAQPLMLRLGALAEGISVAIRLKNAKISTRRREKQLLDGIFKEEK